jgi:hypothetical protein
MRGQRNDRVPRLAAYERHDARGIASRFESIPALAGSESLQSFAWM